MIRFALAVLLLCSGTASAEWKPEYADASPEVQAWYRNAELTAAAQTRFGFKSCCAHSDVVKTKFRPTDNGADGWEYLDEHTWRRVPSDIIHWGKSTPTGEPVMFAIGGRPTCFFPGDSGI